MKALQIGDIKKYGQFYQQSFNNYAAEELTNRGYELRKHKTSFELKKFDRKTIEKFSNRTKEIEQKAKQLGITDKKALNDLGAKTRKNKNTNFTKEYLTTQYFGRLTENEIQKLQQKNTYIKPSYEEKTEAIKKAIEFSLAKNFENNSSANYKTITRDAMAHAITHGVSPKWIDDEFKSLQMKGEVIAKENSKFSLYTTKNYTTKEVRKEEEDILSMIEKSKQYRQEPINPNYQIKKMEGGMEFSEEQKNAITGILQSDDRFMIFSGAAGSGKTSTLKEIEKGIEEKKKEVHIFAPTTGAVEVLSKEGFKNAATVQSFLTSSQTQDKTKKQVIMIDEASLISVPQMKKIMEIAEAQDAKLVLVGDSKQHTSVERGDALRLMEKKKLTKVDIFSIRRQDGEYKEATELIAKGRVVEGYQKLEQMGVIKETKQLSRLYAQASKDYVENLSKGKTIGLYVPTHGEGQAVSKVIRQERLKKGQISGFTTTHETLVDRNLENALKQELDTYKKHDKIIFNQNIGKFKKGQILEVKQDERLPIFNQIHYIDSKNQRQPLPLEHSKAFSFVNSEQIEIAKGDKIRITNAIHLRERKNRYNFTDQGEKMANGAKFVVVEVQKSGDLVVKLDKYENKQKGVTLKEYIIPKEEKRISYAYYSTSHKGQGETVDKAIILASSKSFSAVNDKQFYVSATRGRKSLAIYTDNKEGLSQNIQKSGSRELAIEKTKKEFKYKYKVKEASPEKRLFDRDKKIIEERQVKVSGPNDLDKAKVMDLRANLFKSPEKLDNAVPKIDIRTTKTLEAIKEKDYTQEKEYKKYNAEKMADPVKFAKKQLETGKTDKQIYKDWKVKQVSKTITK